MLALPLAWAPLCTHINHVSSSTRTTHSDVVCVTLTLKPVETAVPNSKHARWASAVTHTSHAPASLPSSLPYARRCEILIHERDEFMRTLGMERNARQRAEAYASTKIQVWSPLCALILLAFLLLGLCGRICGAGRVAVTPRSSGFK